jgi:L-2-hydroxyglutarate oxidase LhgO
MLEPVDCVVIGAGVVGLAIARAAALTGREVIVLEAENSIGTGTSSRNSEVIHAGIYYPSRSLKASLCVSGNRALYDFCRHKNVPHNCLGKVIVATSEAHIPELRKYEAQALTNGVTDLRFLTADQVGELEPTVRCVAGLLSPSTGIVDSHALMLAYQADLESAGGTVVLNSPVLGGSLERHGITLNIDGAQFIARTVINAAGLDAQRVSRTMNGVGASAIPAQFLAKGHYFSLTGRSPFRHLVYPIAEAAGLGIHVTLDMGGKARFGPDVAWIDCVDYSFDVTRHHAFCDAIRQYYPDFDASKLQPAYVGIRPKIVGEGQGSADFCIRGPESHAGCPYVALYGIESPGLTASLTLAEDVVRQLPH